MTQPPHYAQKYRIKGNRLYETMAGKNGSFERLLCNFVPWITAEITLDDGAGTTTWICLRGIHESGRPLPEIEIPAADLAGFNWLAQRWGMDCILEVGKTVKDCVRHAIQTTAAHAEKKTVYAVTGWKNINGKWMYLMPGDVEITVSLPDKMHGYTEWLRENFLLSEEAEQKFIRFLHSRFLFYRDSFRSNGIRCHGRVPETVAQLQIGMEFLLRFLYERGSFAEDWCNDIAERFQKILYSLAVKQAESIDEDKPTHVFIRKLFSLLESERVCVLNRSQSHEFIPGNCIGYEDESYFYLHTDIAHQMVCRLCEEQGENFVISSKGLLKALAEEGLIKTTAGQNTISIRVGRKSRRVMCMDKHKAQSIADEAL